MDLKFIGKKTELELFDSLKIKKNILPNFEGCVLIKGDNLRILYSLLDKFRGKIDLIYIDPPFNTSLTFYSGNGKSNTISNCSNNEIAYEDNLSKDEYLEFLRERLILMRELLSEKGSIYLHIDCKIGHYLKIIMDEIFGEENFKNDITRIKSNPKNFQRKAYGNEKDLILFYAKNKKKNIWNDVTEPIDNLNLETKFSQIDSDGRRFTTIPLHAPGESKTGKTSESWRGMMPPEGRHWRTNPEEFDKLDSEGKIYWSSNGNPRIKRYADEHKGKKIQDVWIFKDPQNPIYPTEKNSKMMERIILQSSLPTSIVMDCFAGGGTTLKVASELGRVWIGIDQSDVAIRTIMNNLCVNYSFVSLSELE